MTRFNSFATLAVLLGSLGMAPAAEAAFGAIAYSPSTGAYGFSYGFSSRNGAENYALDNCNAGDCTVAIWFQNACGALASGANGGWGSGWAGNRAQAENIAIGQCRKYTNKCRVVVWSCSG